MLHAIFGLNQDFHILVVDDEPDLEQLILQKFRKQIREGVFTFTFAGNGVQALERLAEDAAIELVLTDIPSAKALIYPDNIKTYSNLKLKFGEKYYQVEGLIKLCFVTNLRQEYIYASYYVNRSPSIEYLQTQGIDIGSLEEVSV